MAVEAKSYDVVIIGGGLAGLSCAVSLLGARPRGAAGAAPEVALLEWQDRLGGRLCSCKVGDVEADAGAAWVHGIEGNPLIEDGWIRSEDLVPSSAQNIWLHGPVESDSCNFHASEDDKTWERRLAAVAAAASSGQGGRSLQDRIGLLEWDGEHGSMGDYPGAHAILKGGTRILVERLAEEAQRLGLKVFLNHEVRAVEEGANCAHIDCAARRRFCAQFVVVTVSLGVLQSRPGFLALPEKPLQRLEMCRYNKLLLRVSESVADRFPVFTDLESDHFWQLFNYRPLTGKPLMSLASLSAQAEEMTDEDALKVACDLLSLPREEIQAHHFTRWGRVPWACGSYSVSSKDAEWDDIHALLRWTEGKRIKLAGEHTHEEHQGGFHAAYLSGKRAAQEVSEGLQEMSA